MPRKDLPLGAFLSIKGNIMGFSLKVFIEELKYRIQNCQDHMSLLAYIHEMEKYAKECGHLHDN